MAFTTRCADASCASAPTLTVHTFSKSWSVRGADTLRVSWDPAGNQFLFALNPGTAREETKALPYTQSDALPPVLAHKSIRASNTGANCTGDRKLAFIDFAVDDVKVNPEAVP